MDTQNSHYRVANTEIECSIFVKDGVVSSDYSSTYWAARFCWGKTVDEARAYLTGQGFVMEPESGPVAYHPLKKGT